MIRHMLLALPSHRRRRVVVEKLSKFLGPMQTREVPRYVPCVFRHLGFTVHENILKVPAFLVYTVATIASASLNPCQGSDGCT